MSHYQHPSAIVDEGAQIGEGSRVWHWVHICSQARIGARCSFGQNVFVGNDVIIGDNVKVQNNVSIYDAVTLEDDVFCGPSMVFTNVNNPRSHVSRKNEYRRTVVKKGATIGANAGDACSGSAAPHLWQRSAATSLIASHRRHGFRLSCEPHSLQYFAPSGLTCPQNLHWCASMGSMDQSGTYM